MKNEIIYTEHYALIVSDEEIKEGYYFYSVRGLIEKAIINYSKNEHNGVIIAHRPLTDAPVLEGVPLLPEFSQEDSIKDYSLDAAKEFALNHFNGLESKFPKGGYITIKSTLDVLKIGVECGHKFGLKQAKETYNLTLTKLIDLYIEETGYGMDMWSKEENQTMSTIAKIIQSLQQPKRPKYFECGMEQLNNKPGSSYGTETLYRSKIIINSQGQTELVGEYSYE